MSDQSEREILEDILIGLDELMVETKKNRQELRELEAEIIQKHESGVITDLRFDIEKQRARRAHKNVDWCIKSLERQKKIALMKLKELD